MFKKNMASNGMYWSKFKQNQRNVKTIILLMRTTCHYCKVVYILELKKLNVSFLNKLNNHT